MIAKLRPCPFCGSDNVTKESDDGRAWHVCRSCCATGPVITRYSGEEGEPFSDWNSRAIPPTHRVVSVQDLDFVADVLREAGYTKTEERIRAIINNKEQK